MSRARRSSFPVGLYGTLLFALCWLVLPQLLRPVERFLLGVACLPQRLFAHAGGQPALAASAGSAEQLAALRRDLQVRALRDDVRRIERRMPAGMSARCCTVRAVVTKRRGGGRMPCELLLDRSYEDLAGCADFVTKGDALVGFLARPGVGPAERDLPTDPARVLLLNHPEGREVPVRLLLDQGQQLRCVVQAAAIVDPAPLRTTLHDDPYRFARLQSSGRELRTMMLDAAWTGAVPDGLLVGATRIWGYDTGAETLTIGVYAEPPFDPRALAQVVLWQAVPDDGAPPPPPAAAPGEVWPLPDGTGGRWLLTTTATVPDGAAVVQDGVCLGIARGIGFHQALCTSFAASRQPWAIWLLPDEPDDGPIGIYGAVVWADGATAWFEPHGPRAPLVAGFAFTASNGPSCPAGLLIGRAEPDTGRRLLRIVTAARQGSQQIEVVLGGEAN